MPTGVLGRPDQLSREEILSQVEIPRAAALEQAATAVRQFTAIGDWQGVMMALQMVGFSPADIARHLHVMRSTATRWANGQTRPPAEAAPVFAERIVELLKASQPARRRTRHYAEAD
jgi:hypothetical protein